MPKMTPQMAMAVQSRLQGGGPGPGQMSQEGPGEGSEMGVMMQKMDEVGSKMDQMMSMMQGMTGESNVMGQ